MIKKIMLLPVVLMGICGVVIGSAQQPLASGQTIMLNGKVLNSLTFISSNNQSTILDIAAILPMFGTSVQSRFNQGLPVTFSVSADNPYGNGLQYNLQMMVVSSGGTTDYANLGYLNGAPNFEIFYNGVSAGYYFGPGVNQFTIAPVAGAYPAINVPANYDPNFYCNYPSQACPYRIPALGNYFSEIKSMSFTDAAGQNYQIGAVQLAALNQQYENLPQGGVGMSVRVKNNNYVALFAGQSPYPILSNVANLGFPIRVYINAVLVATIGAPLAQNNPNGPLVCVFQK